MLCRPPVALTFSVSDALPVGWWARPGVSDQERQTVTASVDGLAVAIAKHTLARADGTLAVSSDTALSVASFASAYRLVTHQAATLPLRSWKSGVQEPTPALLAQPELSRSRWTTMQRTYADLALHGRAYWAVTRTDWDQYPTRVRHLPAAQVTERDGLIVSAGTEIPMARLIKFEGFEGGLLRTGATTIRKARALSRLAGRRAASAQPTTVFTPRDGAPEPTDEEIDELFEDWEKNPESPLRYTSASVQAERLGWNNRELQLVDSLAAVDGECARLWGIDPAWIGVGVAGSSLTYSNRQDLRAQLVDGPIRMLTQTVEQRLSMTNDDVDRDRDGVGVTPSRDRVVRVDFSGYLRPDLEARVRVAADAFGVGLWTLEEARAYANELFD